MQTDSEMTGSGIPAPASPACEVKGWQEWQTKLDDLSDKALMLDFAVSGLADANNLFHMTTGINNMLMEMHNQLAAIAEEIGKQCGTCPAVRQRRGQKHPSVLPATS